MMVHNMKQETEKSLTKALEILRLFLLSNSNEMALGEISKLSGINKATVHRIVSTLVKYGYLKQPEIKGKYSLDTIFFEFNRVIKNRLRPREVAAPLATRLSQKVHESVSIVLGDGTHPLYHEVFHDMSQVNNIFKIDIDLNVPLQMHCVSMGKIILAYMSEEKLQIYLEKNNLKRFTRNTITDVDELRNQLMTIRQDEVAYDDEEFALGVRSAASGIRDFEGNVIGAISVNAPSVRLTRSGMRSIAADVKDCARDISARLGYNK
jgi:IclR family transcriptional regulator, KDG regulon repressor